MKSLSVSAVAFSIATVTLVICSAFRPNPASRVNAIKQLAAQKRAAAGATSQKKIVEWYWFAEPQDVLFDYNDIYDEEAEWEIMLQANVDTNPGDAGVNVSTAYFWSTLPHMTYAEAALYAHFD